MPDVGGHSIIGGLLTGKGLTAVLPKLKVCARPKTTAAGQACTAVCKPGHQCLNQPFAGRGLTLPPSENAVVVDVFDVERPGTQQVIASFDADVAKCDGTNHCHFGAVDEAKYGKGAAVEIAFGPVSDPTGATDPTQSSPGTAPPNTVASNRACGDKTQGTFFDHAGLTPLYTDSNLEVWGGVSAYQNGNLVGGGVSPQPANDGITFTAKSCSVTPHVVQFVAREVILSNDQLLPGRYLTSDLFNKENFAMSYPNTTDVNNPAWHIDARTPLNRFGVPDPPYYEAGQGAGWCVLGNQLTTFDQPSVGIADGTILSDLQAFNTQNHTNLTVKQAQPIFKTFVLCGDAPIAEFAWHVVAGQDGLQTYRLDSVFNRDPRTLQSDLNGLYSAASSSPNRGRRVPIN